MELDYNRLSNRFKNDLARIVGGAGEVVHAEMYEPEKGGGWGALFTTEYAALKVYYTYRHLPLEEKSAVTQRPDGLWAFSVRGRA